jgi:hypothetical protein
MRAGIGRPSSTAIFPARSIPSVSPANPAKSALLWAECAAWSATGVAVMPASPVGMAKPGVVPANSRDVPSFSATVTEAPRGRLM